MAMVLDLLGMMCWMLFDKAFGECGWTGQVKSRNSLFFQRKMWVPHMRTKTVYIYI